MKLSSRLVSTVFPEFHHVTMLMVYTLHPTTFYQSGRSCSKVGADNVIGFPNTYPLDSDLSGG